MRCGTARTLLPLLLDESLPPSEHHEVVEHFDACPSCAQLRAVHEVPPPPLPSIPDCILAQFGRDLDDALDEELALREALKRQQYSSLGCIQVPRAWMWVYMALLGTATTVAVYGVVRLQYDPPSGLAAASRLERAGAVPPSLTRPATIDYTPAAMSVSGAFTPCYVDRDDSDEYLDAYPGHLNWSAPRSPGSTPYLKTISTASRTDTTHRSQ